MRAFTLLTTLVLCSTTFAQIPLPSSVPISFPSRELHVSEILMLGFSVVGGSFYYIGPEVKWPNGTSMPPMVAVSMIGFGSEGVFPTLSETEDICLTTDLPEGRNQTAGWSMTPDVAGEYKLRVHAIYLHGANGYESNGTTTCISPPFTRENIFWEEVTLAVLEDPKSSPAPIVGNEPLSIRTAAYVPVPSGSGFVVGPPGTPTPANSQPAGVPSASGSAQPSASSSNGTSPSCWASHWTVLITLGFALFVL